MCLRRFCGGREEGAECDIVCALFACDHREVAGIMAGDADDLVEAENAARVFVGRVFLADMDAVGV